MNNNKGSALEMMLRKPWLTSMLLSVLVTALSLGFVLGFFTFLGGRGGSSVQGPGLWTIPVLPGFIAEIAYESVTVMSRCGFEGVAKAYDERLSSCDQSRPDATQECKDYKERVCAFSRCYLENKPPQYVIITAINFLFYWFVIFMGMIMWKGMRKKPTV